MRAQYARHPSRGSPEPRGDRPAVRHEHSEGDFKRDGAEPAALQPSRRATPECLPHEQTEVERAGVHEQSLEEVVRPAQTRAAEAPGGVQVSEGAPTCTTPEASAARICAGITTSSSDCSCTPEDVDD